MMAMGQSIPIIDNAHSCNTTPSKVPAIVVWLQGITLAWMLAECAVSLYAAKTAHSVVLLAFGTDSFVELLSAIVALLSFLPSFPLTRSQAARWAGVLLFALAVVVAVAATLALTRNVQTETSCAGIGITIAALIVMPVLAWLKRRTAKETGNRALAADAVQSATCAYLAAITLSGLAVNALFHIRWIDSVAAFAALPILVIEGRKAMRGESCCCC
jgi:divalent metal cation (Fe/Co/Zn/Cd) transporter